MIADPENTIVAVATAPGTGAIAVLRLSGREAVIIVEKFFYTRGLKKKSLLNAAPNTVHFGVIAVNDQPVDEVLVTVFHAPHSFTGENTVEISCHGSPYIQQKLLSLFLEAGARAAEPGEFTLRAFMHGKLDLAQAEAVADLVASRSASSHAIAMRQMRGGFSSRIRRLRGQLVQFASLIELELDFSEEDVEFANRTQLTELIDDILRVIAQLLKSFELGNVIRHGIPVAIVGRPNAGKSTLLNALLDEDRAIVSDIPGTTRDTVEDVISIDGVLFRFIDTAGLRDSSDAIEQIGVKRSFEAMSRAAVVIYLFDAHETNGAALSEELKQVRQHTLEALVIPVANKSDLSPAKPDPDLLGQPGIISISAKNHSGLDVLRHRLFAVYREKTDPAEDTVVTSARHAHALGEAAMALQRVKKGLSGNIPGDLLAQDLRTALNELANITGEVTSGDLLDNIFSKFCIGK